MNTDQLNKANKYNNEKRKLQEENAQIDKALEWSDLNVSIAVLQDGWHSLTRNHIKLNKSAYDTMLTIQFYENATRICELDKLIESI